MFMIHLSYTNYCKTLTTVNTRKLMECYCEKTKLQSATVICCGFIQVCSCDNPELCCDWSVENRPFKIKPWCSGLFDSHSEHYKFSVKIYFSSIVGNICMPFALYRNLPIIEQGSLGYEEFCRSRRVLSEGFMIHSKYIPVIKGVSSIRSLFFCSPKIIQPRPPRFSRATVQ